MPVTITISGGPFHFSAAHAALPDGQFEPLHGHTYTVSLRLHGEPGNSGMLTDFRHVAAQPARAPTGRPGRAQPGRPHPGRGRRHLSHGHRCHPGRTAAVTACPPAAPGTQARLAGKLPQALLGYVLETRLAGPAAGIPQLALTSPWDLWWVSFRTAIPAAGLGVTGRLPEAFCAACAGDARQLAAASPPLHPGITAGSRACDCLLDWAVRMRAPAVPVTWPALPLTLALIKPGAPAQELRARLLRTHDILLDREQELAAADVRRLYPEAYGAAFTAAVDAFLTAAPVRALVLKWRDGGHDDPSLFKKRLREDLGGTDMLRNHLHMADNPGEALADIRHLAGPDTLAGLYERHARDGAADRLAFYRAALGIRDPGPHRDA